jgi:hypothetical protein
MVISERVDDMSVDEILPLPGIKPPRPLDRSQSGSDGPG